MDYAKFNKNARLFNASTEKRDFVKLEKLYKEDANRVYTLKGFFLNKKGKFGDNYIAIVDNDKLIDLPKNLNETFVSIKNDADAIKGINNNECQFKIRFYHNTKYNKDCYTIDFVENIPF